MGDFLGKALETFLFFYLIVALVALFMNNIDKSLQTKAMSSVTEFVDDIRASGKIDGEAYYNLTKRLFTEGKYGAEITVYQSVNYPEEINNVPTGKIIRNTLTIKDAEIREVLSSDDGFASFPLENGDRIKVTITRKSEGFTVLLNLLPLPKLNKEGTLIGSYAGTVYHTATSY